MTDPSAWLRIEVTVMGDGSPTVSFDYSKHSEDDDVAELMRRSARAVTAIVEARLADGD